MGVRATLSRMLSSVVTRATEGAYRAGPWALSRSGGYLAANVGDKWNWWQNGYSLSRGPSRSAMVEACVSAYAQTVAMCPGDHWRKRDDGGRDRVTTSAASRILRHPNEYQTASDFMLNVTRSLYLHGNTYALALRNDRYEINELHLMDPRYSHPQIASNGDVFYRLAGNDVIAYRRKMLIEDGRWREDDWFNEADQRSLGLLGMGGDQLLVPQRDVLHIRLHAYDHRTWPFPIVGDTPLSAAAHDLAKLDAMDEQQQQFYDNQARPSAVLTTDLMLDKDQVMALRDRWNEQSKGLHAGGVPILTGGLKVQPWTHVTSKDAQTAELLKMTEDRIALVFRVPLAILGVQGASGYQTEALYNSWLASGLGFCLNQIEESLDKLFDLKGEPDEYIELNTESLLRSARKERVDMLVRGVQGSIFSPNEARAMFDMPAVEMGEEPRAQQQLVPLSAAAQIGATPGGAGGAPSGQSGGIGPQGPGGVPSPKIPPAPPAGGAPAAAGISLAGAAVKSIESSSDIKRDLYKRMAKYERSAV